MASLLLVATDRGLLVCERQNGAWHDMRRGLADRRVTSVIAREGVILAGTIDGVFRSDDLGRTWEAASTGLTTRHVRWLAYHPAIADREFAGTEPAGIFVSRDGGATWHECPEVAQLRDTHGWYLPYSPAAGCVRGFAFQGQRAYAAVEVGGVLRSDDGGATWRLADGSSGDPTFGTPPRSFVHPDVHSIAVHPGSPDLVFAPTGGGFYRSADGGTTWEPRYTQCYCRAVWADPQDPDHLILGPAASVDRNGRIEETHDGGHTWQPAAHGLNVPWPRHMVERFAQADEELLAVLSNGELLAAPLSTLAWQRILPTVGQVAAVTTMQAA
jgi:photosystem II stability/assembly factor-like uncharacterized protein